MLQGLYSAASGIISIENRQAVYANNIANASTPGFKRQNPIEKGFYQIFLKEMKNPLQLNHFEAPGGGVKVVETFTDHEGGVMTATGNKLDIGLIGPGFIAVDTPDGVRFSRNGKLSVNVDGQLATNDGYLVQSVDGQSIDVSGSNLQISENGTVIVDGVPSGTIRLVEFQDPHMLERQGHNIYRASDAAIDRSARAGDTLIAHESLEMSNVKLPYEMINMVAALRAYAANQKVINTFSDTTSKVIDQIGAPI